MEKEAKTMDDSMDQIFVIDKDTSTTNTSTKEALETKQLTKSLPPKVVEGNDYKKQLEDDKVVQKARRDMMKRINAKQSEIQNLPIFTKLCDPSKYKKDKKCAITGKTDNLLNCPFCGKTVHKSVLVRERKDPQNPEEFVKICEACNDHYLERQTHAPYWKYCQKFKVLSTDKEKKFAENSLRISQLDAEIARINSLNGAKESDLEARLATEENELNAYDLQIKKILEEKEELVKMLAQIDNDIVLKQNLFRERTAYYEDLEFSYSSNLEQLENLQRELDDISAEIRDFKFNRAAPGESQIQRSTGTFKDRSKVVFEDHVPTVLVENTTVLAENGCSVVSRPKAINGSKENAQVGSTKGGYCTIFNNIFRRKKNKPEEVAAD